MGYATLGYPKGMGVRFRIDPQSIDWSFAIKTSVTPTIGGRVVQVMGATLSDITIQGLFGEDRSKAAGAGELEHPGRSWMLANEFARRIRQIMEKQSIDSTDQGKMNAAPVFSFPPLDIKFRVYVKGFNDPDGGAVEYRTGKFSHGYVLTLFVVQDQSTALIKAGANNGVLNKAKAQAINEYIGRISEGIGWEPSQYHGNFGTYYDELFNYSGKKIHEDEDAPQAGEEGGLTPNGWDRRNR